MIAVFLPKGSCLGISLVVTSLSSFRFYSSEDLVLRK